MQRKVFFLLLMLLTATQLFAGVTGKIAGVVVDKNTGEPLPGVNVLLKGSTMGASTDIDGYYVILNVPPGEHSLEVQYVGYATTTVNAVKVHVDLTTTVNVDLSETTLETADEIVVIAQRPVVRTDETSTRHFVSSEEIEIQPVNSFQQIARNQAGVVGNSFRGGRSGEVLVMIDGIPVRDPAGQYSGSLGGFTANVPEFGIQELEVSLGGFSAEYGNVQSGLLNLALKEGATKFTGRLRLTTIPGFGSGSSYSVNGTSFKQLEKLQNIYELNLNGPIIPGKLSFSLAADVTDQQRGFLMNQEYFDQSYQGKLTYRFTPQHKLAFGGVYSNREWDQYYFPASKYGAGPNYQSDTYFNGVKNDTLTVFRYVNDQNLFGTSKTENVPGVYDSTNYNVLRTRYSASMQEYLWDRQRESYMGYMLWTHALSERTFYELRFNHFFSNYHYSTRDIDDRDGDGDRDEDLQWDLAKAPPHPIFREREENYWWTLGDDPGFRDQRSWTYTVKADMVSQVNSNNLLKGGIELNYHRTKVENISWTLGVGINRKDIWDLNSLDAAAYIQDKLEFKGIIALIGLRFDTFDPTGGGDDIFYPADYANPYSQVDADGNPIFINPQKAQRKYQFSPRIGISHPITDKSVLHFTYGHYFQRADGLYLYRNYKMQDFTKVGNFVGHPNLEPEKTVAYEIGIEQELPYGIRASLTAYYKDITNLMNWQKYVARSIQDRELNVYTNADYGNIKGIELSLNKRLSQYIGGNFHYTYSIAKGRSSSASGGSGSFTSARRMNLLNFDQTHTLKANITIKSPEDFGNTVGQFRPLANWLANIQFSYGSGLPYSSFGTNTVNDARLPWTSTTDMKLIRQFKAGQIGIDVFMDIFNLFDRRNVDYIGDNEYYDLGDPNDSSIKSDPSVVRRLADGTYVRNAQAYSDGRYFRFGVGVHF